VVLDPRLQRSLEGDQPDECERRKQHDSEAVEGGADMRRGGYKPQGDKSPGD
jgi:hypothetical protein